MNTALHDCRDFVRRVRRRMVLARAARRVLLALAVGGGAAGVTLVILAMLGRPELPAMGAIVAAGVLGGLCWALWRIPGTITAARWIDRQLRWSDLLTTALTQGDFNDPAWTQSVIALAAAQCRQHPAADVPVLTPPRWAAAAVGMELALVLALGIFCTPSGQNDPFAAARESADQVDSPPASIGTAARHDAALPRPAGDSNLDEQRSLGNTPESTQASNDADSHSAASMPNAHHTDANNGGVSPISGSGAAVTDVHPSPLGPQPITASGSSTPPGGTPVTGGTGLANATAGGTAGSGSGGTVTPGQASSSNDPLSPLAADDAAAIRAGRVPAEDMDLVRDFFQPGQR